MKTRMRNLPTHKLATTLKDLERTVATAAAGGGITRSVSTISAATTAGAGANTDYVYLVSGTTALTLPSAVSNTNRYAVVNTGTNTVTIGTTGGQTINGTSTASLTTQYSRYELVSNGSNWLIVSA